MSDAKEGVRGRASAVKTATDPLIGMARLMTLSRVRFGKSGDPGRSEKQAHAKIAKARFAVEGTSSSRATFTLRLAFGTVKGSRKRKKDSAAHLFRGAVRARHRK